MAGDRVKVRYRVDNRSDADLDAWLLESCDCDAGDLASNASLVILCLSACTNTLRILCPCTPTKPNIVVDVSVVCVVAAGQYSIFGRAKSQRTEQTIEKKMVE